MPIYAYRCDACGFRKDVLQKLSDPALVTCPSCGAASFAKQLSAPAFQLKGTGWYVTDFRDKGKKADGKAETPPSADAPATTSADGADKALPAKAAAGASEGSAASSTPAVPSPGKAGSAAGASAETA
jgi:putative FmdB family regulatory protein